MTDKEEIFLIILQNCLNFHLKHMVKPRFAENQIKTHTVMEKTIQKAGHISEKDSNKCTK